MRLLELMQAAVAQSLSSVLSAGILSTISAAVPVLLVGARLSAAVAALLLPAGCCCPFRHIAKQYIDLLEQKC